MGFFSSLKKSISSLPVVGKPLAAVYTVSVGPMALAEDIAKGKRIDKALIGSFKEQLGAAKTIAPYAQSVVSFVPGVGTGVSGAMAAAMAIADGHKLNEAVLAGIKGAIPGGPIAQSAFSAATAIAQGKKLDQVALSALPIPDSQKKALGTALEVAKKIGKGEKVQDIVLTEAMKQLPPDLAKAAQIGIAVGQAANIQKHNKKAIGKVDTVLKAVNSKDPVKRKAALVAVKRTQLKAERGDHNAAGMMTMLGRRAAAKRVQNRFRVDGHSGIVLRVGGVR